MLPISERMAMAISITNDIICDFLTGMILFWTCIFSSKHDRKFAIFSCSKRLENDKKVFLICVFEIELTFTP